MICACGAKIEQGGDGWGELCQDCADRESAKSHVYPEDFGDISMDILEDESHLYGLPNGMIFAGMLRMFGVISHVSLVQCEEHVVIGRRRIYAADFKLQHLVDAALLSDRDVYVAEAARPNWVKLAAWPGLKYLLTFSHGTE